MLAAAGYETALVGKWHLGVGEDYQPRKRGFQHFYGFLNGTIDYETHLSGGGGLQGQRATYRNETPVEEQGYFPELKYREAARFIDGRGSKPCFLFLSLALPHLPLQVPKKYSAVYAHIPNQNRASYAGMVSCLDQGVGKVMTALENKRFSDNTLVIFLSDHGWVKLSRNPGVAAAGDNGALRGGKYELTEGGLRVPCVVRWPGQIRPRSVSDTPTMTIDWVPTIREIVGFDGNPLRRLDGVNLLGSLVGTENRARERYSGHSRTRWSARHLASRPARNDGSCSKSAMKKCLSISSAIPAKRETSRVKT